MNKILGVICLKSRRNGMRAMSRALSEGLALSEDYVPFHLPNDYLTGEDILRKWRETGVLLYQGYPHRQGMFWHLQDELKERQRKLRKLLLL